MSLRVGNLFTFCGSERCYIKSWKSDKSLFLEFSNSIRPIWSECITNSEIHTRLIRHLAQQTNLVITVLTLVFFWACVVLGFFSNLPEFIHFIRISKCFIGV